MGLDMVLTERRAEYAEALECALDELVAHLSNMPEVERVILFGSYADGTFDMDSDVDVLVVASGLPRGWGRRRVCLERFGFPARLETFPYTPGEFLETCRRGGGVAYSALTEGQVLYLDPDYREQLLRVL